jgi:uncharacterized Zn finger protein
MVVVVAVVLAVKEQMLQEDQDPLEEQVLQIQ